MDMPLDRRRLLHGIVATALLASTGSALAGVQAPIFEAVNPFATATAEEIAWVVGPTQRDHVGNGVMWLNRGQAFFFGVVWVLVMERDEDRIELDADVILDHFKFEKFVTLGVNSCWPPGQRSYVNHLLASLPGYDAKKGLKQSPATLDQFRFATMIATERLERMTAANVSWADAWAEADPKNRREGAIA